ncbi:MAG: DUF72 domain-containing protein [Candidatus Rokubacteria bacterium]|nr:DUF72 domain-containing protein [Candidatus Rokubacteria bacterium]
MLIRVGCCGWPVARPRYFAAFDLIEIQESFYNLPRLPTVEKWRAAAPASFQFVLKAPYGERRWPWPGPSARSSSSSSARPPQQHPDVRRRPPVPAIAPVKSGSSDSPGRPGVPAATVLLPLASSRRSTAALFPVGSQRP